jgi:hypothetical protein
MSPDLIQTLIVSGIAIGAAGILIRRIVGPYFSRPTAGAPCARCASGEQCTTAKPQTKVIQIQRRA